MPALSKPKTLRPSRQVEKILIRPMESGDLKEVTKLEKLSFQEPYSRADFLAELKNDRASILVAEKQERIIGYVDFWSILDEIHLISIAVHPRYRRSGIAGNLLRSMYRYCPGYDRVFLEVRPSNMAAVRFYQRKGFRMIGLRKAYYQNREDALVMEKCKRR